MGPQSNEYKTRMRLFHCLSSFSPLPTSLVLQHGGTSLNDTSHPREHIVALGNMDYRHATSGIMAALDANSLSLSRSLRSTGAEVYRQAEVEPTRGEEGDEED